MLQQLSVSYFEKHSDATEVKGDDFLPFLKSDCRRTSSLRNEFEACLLPSAAAAFGSFSRFPRPASSVPAPILSTSLHYVPCKRERASVRAAYFISPLSLSLSHIFVISSPKFLFVKLGEALLLRGGIYGCKFVTRFPSFGQCLIH